VVSGGAAAGTISRACAVALITVEDRTTAAIARFLMTLSRCEPDDSAGRS
jgi:hypothetical protein